MPEETFASLFEDPVAWQVFASGQAAGRVTGIAAAGDKPGIRLEYDFHRGGGFVVIRRPLAVRLPETFEAGFLHRGDGPHNHFEFKVASPGGANVWRHLRQDYELPPSWSPFRFNERSLPFAWGPAGGGAPAEIEAVEIVVAAGPGGRGHIDLTDASFEDRTLRDPRAVCASSAAAGMRAEDAFGPSQAGWRAAADDPQPWWLIDFGRALRFGGLVIRWAAGLPARAFRIEVSDDGSAWTTLFRATRALGATTFVSAPGAEAGFLRLVFDDAACAAMRSIELRPDAFSRTPNEFIHAVAAELPRGWHPRYWHREQSYWTPVGSPEGRRRALVNEQGMIEVDEAGFSLEPFVLTETGMESWADVTARTAHARGGIPVPQVTWRARGWKLEIQPWVDGKGDALTLRTTYRLKRAGFTGSLRLAVAVRPFQVNPPWQAFRNLGGASPIHRIACTEQEFTVDGRVVFTDLVPAATGAAMFEEGGAIAFLATGEAPPSHSVDDPAGLASAAMLWEIPADAREWEVTLSVPFFGRRLACDAGSRRRALARWRRALGKVRWEVPAAARPAIDCLRAAAGHILINRDGPAIQPGPRRYTRSWVRDCVIMGAALAKAGIPGPLREFLEWYAPFQRDDGFIPCVVDRDGVDWLVEHDSHGQFLWGLREALRHRPDRRFLTAMFPHARKAADYLLEIRAQRLTAAYRSGPLAAAFGLLPESASHEGYLAHPVHSYWDDFWGIRGLEAASDLAEAADDRAAVVRWRAEAASFQADVLASLRTVIAEKNLRYIPGSVEWADFDPTATSNAIAMLDFAPVLPQQPLHEMFETYLDGHRRKHAGAMPWTNYTAYEIRIIGALVRLGERGVANELLDFFLGDRRPPAWNQWPEITWRDPLSPGHLGDVPHTWIAAEFILALGSMVAAEREASSSLVLASGLRWDWIAADRGFAVRNLPTRFGPLDFHIHAPDTATLSIRIAATIELPAGGLIVAPPLPAGMRLADGDPPGAHLAADGLSLAVTSLPFSTDLKLAAGPSCLPALRA